MSDKILSLKALEHTLNEYYSQDKYGKERQQVEAKVAELSRVASKQNKDDNPFFFGELLSFITEGNMELEDLVSDTGDIKLDVFKVAKETAQVRLQEQNENIQKNKVKDKEVFENISNENKMTVEEVKKYFARMDFSKSLTSKDHFLISQNMDLFLKNMNKENIKSFSEDLSRGIGVEGLDDLLLDVKEIIDNPDIIKTLSEEKYDKLNNSKIGKQLLKDAGINSKEKVLNDNNRKKLISSIAKIDFLYSYMIGNLENGEKNTVEDICNAIDNSYGEEVGKEFKKNYKHTFYEMINFVEDKYYKDSNQKNTEMFQDNRTYSNSSKEHPKPTRDSEFVVSEEYVRNLKVFYKLYKEVSNREKLNKKLSSEEIASIFKQYNFDRSLANPENFSKVIASLSDNIQQKYTEREKMEESQFGTGADYSVSKVKNRVVSNNSIDMSQFDTSSSFSAQFLEDYIADNMVEYYVPPVIEKDTQEQMQSQTITIQEQSQVESTIEKPHNILNTELNEKLNTEDATRVSAQEQEYESETFDVPENKGIFGRIGQFFKNSFARITGKDQQKLLTDGSEYEKFGNGSMDSYYTLSGRIRKAMDKVQETINNFFKNEANKEAGVINVPKIYKEEDKQQADTKLEDSRKAQEAEQNNRMQNPWDLSESEKADFEKNSQNILNRANTNENTRSDPQVRANEKRPIIPKSFSDKAKDKVESENPDLAQEHFFQSKDDDSDFTI